MAEELRNAVGLPFIHKLAQYYQKEYADFNKKDFLLAAEENLDELALKQRLTRLSTVSRRYLPDNFRKATDLLLDISPLMDSQLAALFVPEFIATYGLDDVEYSLAALAQATQYSSSEFAIREFLVRDFAAVMPCLNRWSEDENHHIRRLASEGSRPRLPWSFQLKNLMQDPRPAFDILNRLKSDPELYVRKSVANHLNDISKDNAEVMLDLVEGWDKSDIHTAWIIRHGCRSLLKAGHPRSFALFDFEGAVDVQMKSLKIEHQNLSLGETQEFSFNLSSNKNTPQKLAVDYAIYYRKKNGKQQPKVFKLKEVILAPNEEIHVGKRQKFENFTTRKHYSGEHGIEILVNGKVMMTASFNLIC